MLVLDPPAADTVEKLAKVQLPESSIRRMQSLMDRNSEGTIQPPELQELTTLVELNESMVLFRGYAMILLGRTPDVQ